MTLLLRDGTRAVGRPFGARVEARGEVVFHTAMSGYIEALTDPSYRGQILVATYPLQGNYGVPDGPFESDRVQVSGLVVARHSARPSHHASRRSLGEWLVAHGVPAIEGVDTRALTRRLRERGTIDGCLVRDAEEADAAFARAPGIEMARVAELVAPRETTRHAGPGPRILLVDTGAKENIVRSLVTRGAAVVRAPFFAAWEAELPAADGILLTNGPGDPADLAPLVARLRPLLDSGIPIFGVCLGHQLLALAAGASTYKMRYGHRSVNQPVQEASTRRAFVTSQNHGYAVDERTLPRDFEPWFANLNDGTNEGLRHRYRPVASVQFHPEASPGPQDTAHLFDDFLRLCGALRTGAR